MLTHAAWTTEPSLAHGFLDRHDCADAPQWSAVLARCGVSLPLARPRQVHGTTVLLADAVAASSEGDAVVAMRPGIAVGIITADCVPLLLRDRRGRAVAAVHAGWRGAAAGVIERTLETLRQAAGVAPSDLEAVIGPAVGACCYEVGAEVHRAFVERAGVATQAAFSRRGDRFMLDLRGAVGALAGAAGVASVNQLGPCTVCDRDFASYRRDAVAAGRQLSFIALR